MNIRVTPNKKVKTFTVHNYFSHLPIHETFECHIFYKYIDEYVVYILPLKYADDPQYINHEGLVKTVFHLNTIEKVTNSPF